MPALQPAGHQQRVVHERVRAVRRHRGAHRPAGRGRCVCAPSSSRAAQLMVDGLNAIPGVTCVMPHGAFYAFPNISSFGRTSSEIADHLLYDARRLRPGRHRLRQARRGLPALQLRQLAGEPGRRRWSAWASRSASSSAPASWSPAAGRDERPAPARLRHPRHPRRGPRSRPRGLRRRPVDGRAAAAAGRAAPPRGRRRRPALPAHRSRRRRAARRRRPAAEGRQQLRRRLRQHRRAGAHAPPASRPATRPAC